MDIKEINELRSTKPHKDQEKLTKLWNDGLEVGEISKLLHISVKLVHIKLKEYGLT
jgi:DNA-directed RNA polymerase specialized sigma24 family protein